MNNFASQFVKNKRTWSGPGVYCGRPSTYGNLWVIGKDGTRAECIAWYREWFLSRSVEFRRMAVRELRGQNLICWCKPLPCHMDFVCEYVNDPKNGELS
jgi:hypothetical protein